MKLNVKIALSVPSSIKSDRYFSLRLKESMKGEYSQYIQPKRILVLSNIESNFSSFCKVLIKFGIINKKMQWIFGDNHVVILGDCFDRGDEATECMWLIYSLEEKAKRKKGYVHFILSNNKIEQNN